MSAGRICRFDLSGTWREMGCQLGRAVGNDIRFFNGRYFSDAISLMRFGTRDHLDRYVRRMDQAFKDYSPSAWEFLSGMAEGASLPMDQILMQAILPELTHVNAGSDWPEMGPACTNCCIAAGSNATQGALIGQCWDFNVELPNWYVAKLSPPLGLPPILIVGMGSFFCCSGINGSGLALTFTSSGHLPNVRPEVGAPLAAFFLEALCTEGYYEAMDTIVAPRKAGAYNILLTDGYAKNVLIEAAGNRVDLIEGEPVLVCANHFQHPGMVQATGQDLQPPEPPAREFARSSSLRAERLRALLGQVQSKELGLDYLKKCLQDHENHPLSVCAHPESTILHFRTLGAMILEPASRAIHFCPESPCQGVFETILL